MSRKRRFKSGAFLSDIPGCQKILALKRGTGSESVGTPDLCAVTLCSNCSLTTTLTCFVEARCCKSSLAFVNSHLVCLLPVRILNLASLNLIVSMYITYSHVWTKLSSSLFTLSRSFKVTGVLIIMKKSYRRKDVTPACILPFADDPCEDSPCLNGGTCMATQEEDSHFKCNCTAGFTGAHCEGTETCKTTPGPQFFAHWQSYEAAHHKSFKVLQNVYESNAATVDFENFENCCTKTRAIIYFFFAGDEGARFLIQWMTSLQLVL